jgi:hypothetical protein
MAALPQLNSREKAAFRLLAFLSILIRRCGHVRPHAVDAPARIDFAETR